MTTAADCFTLTECNCTKVRYAGDFSISNLCDLHQYPDHNPLHFHIRMNDGREALVEIETMEIHSDGISQRDIKEALNWAADNRDMLIAKFREYNP